MVGLQDFNLEEFAESLFESFKAYETVVGKENSMVESNFEVKKLEESQDPTVQLRLVCPVIMLDKDYKDLTEYERAAMLNASITIIAKTLNRLQEIKEAKNKIQIINSMPSDLIVNDRRKVR